MAPVRSAAAVLVFVATFALTAIHVRERNGSEASAIGAIRAIISGEQSYAGANGGYYDTWECLVPPSCIPGVQSPTGFISPDLWRSRERLGYRLEFHAGPPAGREPRRSRSPSSLTRFAVVAVPIHPRIPGRAFCGDDRRRIYQIKSGAVPRVESGRCLDTSEPLQ